MIHARGMLRKIMHNNEIIRICQCQTWLGSLFLLTCLSFDLINTLLTSHVKMFSLSDILRCPRESIFESIFLCRIGSAMLNIALDDVVQLQLIYEYCNLDKHWDNRIRWKKTENKKIIIALRRCSKI